MFRSAGRLIGQLRRSGRLGSFIRHSVLPSFVKNRKQIRPIFVMCPAASGATWIGAMLGHLPSHVYVHELKLGGGTGLRVLRGLQAIRFIVPGRLLFVLFEGFERARLWSLDCHNEHLGGHRPELLMKENLKELDLANPAKNHWKYSTIDSAGSQINFAALLRKAYPNAVLCYIIRDPRDVCASIKYRKQFGVDHEIEGWAKVVLKEYHEFLRQKDRLDIDPIRYEDWLADAKGELSKFLEHHHLEMSEEQLHEAYIQHDAKAMKAGITNKKGNLSVAQHGSWTSTISPSEKESLKSILTPVLMQFGYVTSVDW